MTLGIFLGGPGIAETSAEPPSDAGPKRPSEPAFMTNTSLANDRPPEARHVYQRRTLPGHAE